MSRTAKRPRGGYSAKVSTVMGLVGIIFTNPASPFFRNLGSFSNSLPERRSTLVMISANFTAMCEVWQSSTGAYPLPIWPGWFMMITCDVKLAASLAGSFFESEATKPRFRSFTATFLTLNPTLSPGSASVSASWCISTDFTSVVSPVGAKHTSMPGLITPVSTRPTGTVPIPPILYTSCSGSLSGLSDGRLGSETLSSASSSVGPLYQSKFVDLSIMLSPSKPEMGTKGILSGLYPTFFRYADTSLEISSYRALEYLGVVASILLQQQIICFTPSVKASNACSRVCPSLEIPASNPPVVESMISTAQSACDVPVIMFLMKSLWPGASITVQ
ncbi:hypothetical protein Mapa_000436 [Marchantia paleacea]|nr:hypothetical protein Mapa_000436 [Marchantia paleacea]